MKDLVVIIPLHEYNEEVEALLSKAIKSVPEELEIRISCKNGLSEAIKKAYKKNKNIVAITAAMRDGVGLTEFSKVYPDRFFDVGIAEEHALTFAAGLAREGLIPFVSIYSSFYQRGYDQIIHDICIQNLHVIMCVDRAGIVGEDGMTHHGVFDMAFFKIIPNIVVIYFSFILKSPLFL